MKVQILGNNSGGPFHGRYYSAHVLSHERDVFLIDCGEGTQMQMFKYQVKAEAIRQIFITHLHGDHVFGLIGLLTSYCLKQRVQPLTIYSPPGMQKLIDTHVEVCGIRFPYILEVVEVDCFEPQKVFENSRMTVQSVPLKHRAQAVGWVFRTKPRTRNIWPEAIERFRLSHAQIRAAKNGEVIYAPDGSEIPKEALLRPQKPVMSYAYCSDTMPSEQVIKCVGGVDLLYHEATFLDQLAAQAEYTGHSTALQAAQVALSAGVRRLLIGHLSGRYPNFDLHLKEARTKFKNTDAALEGAVFQISSGS